MLAGTRLSLLRQGANSYKEQTSHLRTRPSCADPPTQSPQPPPCPLHNDTPQPQITRARNRTAGDSPRELDQRADAKLAASRLPCVPRSLLSRPGAAPCGPAWHGMARPLLWKAALIRPSSIHRSHGAGTWSPLQIKSQGHREAWPSSPLPGWRRLPLACFSRRGLGLPGRPQASPQWTRHGPGTDRVPSENTLLLPTSPCHPLPPPLLGAC